MTFSNRQARQENVSCLASLFRSEQLKVCLVTENLKFTESAIGKSSGNIAYNNKKLLKI